MVVADPVNQRDGQHPAAILKAQREPRSARVPIQHPARGRTPVDDGSPRGAAASPARRCPSPRYSTLRPTRTACAPRRGFASPPPAARQAAQRRWLSAGGRRTAVADTSWTPPLLQYLWERGLGGEVRHAPPISQDVFSPPRPAARKRGLGGEGAIQKTVINHLSAVVRNATEAWCRNSSRSVISSHAAVRRQLQDIRHALRSNASPRGRIRTLPTG